MSRIPLVNIENASPEVAELLKKTQAQLGRIPNLYKAMANSPASLEAYLSFRGALIKGRLTYAMREHLALLVAEVNGCQYCVSAHFFRGGKIGISEEELNLTRQGQSHDKKIASALLFAKNVMRTKGKVTNQEISAVRESGWSDEEISEIVAHVALNIFSNYFNHVAEPELDFPLIKVGSHE